jgi:cytidylate kinase
VVVTVDGPAGVGKSTVARAVAGALGLPYLDTGAYYRAAALAVIRAGVEPGDRAAALAVVANAGLDFRDEEMLLDGEVVSEAIRDPSVAGAASAVSTDPALRRLVVQAQRDWVDRAGGRAVVEGRDIGTVVFPDAGVKVFLTADPAERARRRAQDPESAGLPVEEIERQLRARDHTDSTREASPLRPAADAVIIDTTGLSVRDVVAVVLGLVAEARE